MGQRFIVIIRALVTQLATDSSFAGPFTVQNSELWQRIAHSLGHLLCKILNFSVVSPLPFLDVYGMK
jgi:hypothetical protein